MATLKNYSTVLEKKISQIDELTRSDHWFLKPDDRCYFIGEFERREVGQEVYSPAQDLIDNFKKDVSFKGKLPWRYKLDAIDQVASKLARYAFGNACLVPVPPSIARGAPDYDDRLLQTLLLAQARCQHMLVAEPVFQSTTIPKSRDGERQSIEQLRDAYEFDGTAIPDEADGIVIFDDVLTTGRHFRALADFLAGLYPSLPVRGLFLCRRKLAERPEIDMAAVLRSLGFQ